MDNSASNKPQSSVTLPDGVRRRLAGKALANDDSAIWIVVASAQNWPEFTCLGVDEIALGDDDLIRLALWSASTCCVTLLGARRATLLVLESGGTWEIRCQVMANANLAILRPLSSFLLKPVGLLDGRAIRNARNPRSVRCTPKSNQNRASETRLALFDAFPVGEDGKNAPPGGVRSSRGAPPASPAVPSAPFRAAGEVLSRPADFSASTGRKLP
jgi:hypothetical protein